MTNNKKYYPWIVVALLWGVALLNYMDRQMLSTMKSAMMIDITELESATNFGRLDGGILMDIRPDEPCRRYDRRSDQP